MHISCIPSCNRAEVHQTTVPYSVSFIIRVHILLEIRSLCGSENTVKWEHCTSVRLYAVRFTLLQEQNAVSVTTIIETWSQKEIKIVYFYEAQQFQINEHIGRACFTTKEEKKEEPVPFHVSAMLEIALAGRISKCVHQNCKFLSKVMWHWPKCYIITNVTTLQL
jgi:hypothetical protein